MNGISFSLDKGDPAIYNMGGPGGITLTEGSRHRRTNTAGSRHYEEPKTQLALNIQRIHSQRVNQLLVENIQERKVVSILQFLFLFPKQYNIKLLR